MFLNDELDEFDLDEILADLEEIRVPTELDLKEWEWRGDWQTLPPKKKHDKGFAVFYNWCQGTLYPRPLYL